FDEPIICKRKIIACGCRDRNTMRTHWSGRDAECWIAHGRVEEILTHHHIGKEASVRSHEVTADKRDVKIRGKAVASCSGRHIAGGGSQMNIPAAPVQSRYVLTDLDPSEIGPLAAQATRGKCAVSCTGV